MANRLAFDIGLHLSCGNAIPQQETRIRDMVMKSCVIYDRYWGLFLGRPLAIKSQDVDLLSNCFSQLTHSLGESERGDMAREIYEQLIELMELAGRIVESRSMTCVDNTPEQANTFDTGETEENAYLQVINLDRQLQNWYRRLPEYLAWKAPNIKTAPYSFFLLHQQYHVTMILLHRPWARYGSITEDGGSTGSHPRPESDRMHTDDTLGQHTTPGKENDSPSMGDPQKLVKKSRTSLSRSICTQQAIRVARIFWQHRQKYDGHKIFITGMQHAGTAAIALIAALAHQRNETDHRMYIGYLEILSDAIGDMSHTYQPANRMNDLLEAVLGQIRSSLGAPHRARSGSGSTSYGASHGTGPTSVVGDGPSSAAPHRRESIDADSSQPPKRRRPADGQVTSGFVHPQMPFPTPTPVPTSYATRDDLPHVPDQSSQFNSLLFPIDVNDTSGPAVLDYLGHGPGMNQTEDPRVTSGTDSVNLSIPSTEPWMLNNMQILGTFFNPSIDWTAGPAGLSASSVLGQSAAMTSGIMSTTPNFPQKGDEGRPKVERNDWMGNNGVGQGPGMMEKGSGANGDRNHALDFFSFS